MQTLNILKENCDPKKDDNAKLTYNAYLVQYKVGDKDEARWDLAMSYKSVEIFDYYYDIFALKPGERVKAGTPLDSIRSHKMAYITSDKENFSTSKIKVTPYLHDKKLF